MGPTIKLSQEEPGEAFQQGTFIKCMTNQNPAFKLRIKFEHKWRMVYESTDLMRNPLRITMEFFADDKVLLLWSGPGHSDYACYFFYSCGKFLYLSPILDNDLTKRMKLQGSWQNIEEHHR